MKPNYLHIIPIVVLTFFSSCMLMEEEDEPTPDPPQNPTVVNPSVDPSVGNDILEKEIVGDSDLLGIDFFWVKNLAVMGHARAQFLMGYIYERGIFVDQNWDKAFEWYYKSALQDDSVGQYNTGLCYYYGNGIAQDKQKAKYWIQKSADQENTKARLFLLENEF